VFSDLTPLKVLLELFKGLRRSLRKPPSTSELLAWLRLIERNPSIMASRDIRQHSVKLKTYIGAVAKVTEDTDKAVVIIDSWAKGNDN
jgi:hypothetical protein